MLRRLLNALLYFPSPAVTDTPATAGLEHRDLWFQTGDGERLHGWWIPASAPLLGHLLVCHGNAGNIGERIPHAHLLTAVGFDVLLFDYRGYGNSSGRPTEAGTYCDARAARACLLEQPDVDPARVFYLGESLGGAVALELALAHPPAGLAMMSSFTNIREMSRLHYPFIPAALVPDAYPSLDCVQRLRAPLLVMHGERDEVVPVSHGKALFDSAPDPKRLRVFPGAGHNDLVSTAGPELAAELAAWAAQLRRPAAG